MSKITILMAKLEEIRCGWLIHSCKSTHSKITFIFKGQLMRTVGLHQAVRHQMKQIIFMEV